MTDSEDDFGESTKKAGKKILAGMTKGGIIFTKRVAEGTFNAKIRQTEADETIDKIKIAGSEMGKAIVKGTVESVQKSAPEIIEGVSALAKAFNKKYKPKKEDT
jgi:hypothetical protein